MIEVEHRALRALEQHVQALVDPVVEQHRGLGDMWRESSVLFVGLAGHLLGASGILAGLAQALPRRAVRDPPDRFHGAVQIG